MGQQEPQVKLLSGIRISVTRRDPSAFQADGSFHHGVHREHRVENGIKVREFPCLLSFGENLFRACVVEKNSMKMKNPEALLSCFSRLAVRSRPSPTCVHRYLRTRCSISAWTPGLPLTGITVRRLGIPTCP